MRNDFWHRTIRLCLAILCIASLGGVSSVAAHQRGDASLPTEEDGWSEWGEVFYSSSQADQSTITGDTYILPSTGTVVVVSNGVEAQDPSESTFEDQVLLTTPGGIGAVAVIQGVGYPVSIMDAYVEGFAESMDNVEAIDVQEDRSQASGLYIVNMDGLSMQFYITVDAATMPGSFIIQVAVAATGDIDDSVALLRENVLVDGVPMFADVDEQALQRLLDD